MRVANMPYIYPDADKKRFEFRRRYPAAVKAIVKKTWFRHKFPQHVTEAMANELSHDLVNQFNGEVANARERLRGDSDVVLDVTCPAHRLNMERAIIAAHFVGAKNLRLRSKPVTEAVTLDMAIQDWKRKRGDDAWRDKTAAAKAETTKRRAALSLFASARTSDMAAITTAMIQVWMDGLAKRQAYDYVSEVKALYNRLDANNRLPGGNPAAKIETPPKPEHIARDEFSPERAATILASALASADPLIRWGHMLMAFTGAIVSEIVYAKVSEFKEIDGVWVWTCGAGS